MRVLVACEYSGTVRDAFRVLGHDAMSADLLPTDVPGPHYEGDVLDLLCEPFDLVVAHPPCTYLSNSGAPHLKTDPDRWHDMYRAAGFFWAMSQFNAPRIAIENPIQHLAGRAAHGLGKYTQIVQPWMFGHPETKATCLWLENLPPLMPTDDVEYHMELLPKRLQQRNHWISPSPDRWKLRSTTYPGLAAAMAKQWGGLAELL